MLLGAVLSALIFTAMDKSNDAPQMVFSVAHANTFDADALSSLCGFSREPIAIVGRGQQVGCICESLGRYSFEPMDVD